MKSKSVAFTTVLLALPAGAAVYYPVATNDSFYRRDIIFGSNTALGATGASSNFDSRQFYENGIIAADGVSTLTGGLNANGAYSIVNGGNTLNFQLRGDAVNNAHVFHSQDLNRTLNLSTASAYSSLSFLVSGATNTLGNLNFTINYTTGAATTGQITGIPNWGTTATNEVFNVARTTSNTTVWNGIRETDEKFSFFNYEFAVDAARDIQSIDFSLVGGQLAFMGISGVAVPEPSTAVLLGCAGLALLLRRRK